MVSPETARKGRENVETDVTRLSVIVSTDPKSFERARKSCQQTGPALLWLMSDPRDLLLSLCASIPHEAVHARGIIEAVSFDFAVQYTSEDSLYRQVDVSRARQIADVASLAASLADHVGVLGCTAREPLVVMNVNPRLKSALCRAGLILAPESQPVPGTYVVVPRGSSTGFSRNNRAESMGIRTRGREDMPARLPASAVLLQPDLWFDAGACSLIHQSRGVPLTARECSLLSFLLRAPGRFHSARELACWLTKPGAPIIDDHSVEQVITTLRKKLGETKGCPRVILNRRGMGYGIFSGHLI